MYEKHFGFKERPFALTPDPAFLYHSAKHSMAYAMLEYGVLNHIPIALITGEVGSGKTTLVRQLLDQLDQSVVVGLISNTHRAFGDLIQWISMAYGLEHEGRDKVTLYRRFADFLIAQYAAGRRSVLIVDEAQNMDIETLEELRLLTNINADKNNVLQLVLVGQPELRETLNKPQLEQFVQRIGADYHLEVLDKRETREYIRHRLAVAGCTRNPFQPDAMDVVFECSGGVPRLINTLCDSALVYAYADDRLRITGRVITQMVQERRKRGLFGAGNRGAVSALDGAEAEADDAAAHKLPTESLEADDAGA